MSVETALVVSKDDAPIFWHLPIQRSVAHLPDSQSLWDVLWEHRQNIKGVAHTHPGSGWASPSHEDLTTFDAVEKGLGLRLHWWIATSDRVVLLQFSKETSLYELTQVSAEPGWTQTLRDFSHY